jgi:hypothetical protein
MAKERRSNKEAKKPKQVKPKETTPTSSFASAKKPKK